MEDKPMTGEEVLQQILGALNGNGMQQAANGVYELCAYVDSMTHKVEDMTEEIARLREDIQKMQEDTLTNRLKKSLSEAADRLEKRCEEIKQQIFEVKESIKNKAGEIMTDFKMRGKAALNRVSEFIGLKDKLVGIRNKVKEGIVFGYVLCWIIYSMIAGTKTLSYLKVEQAFLNHTMLLSGFPRI